MAHDATAEKLVRMANQIATFFHSQPKMEQQDGVATHINKFWEPRMRRQFLEMIDAGDSRFDPLVIAAAAKVRRPAPVPAKTAKPRRRATA